MSRISEWKSDGADDFEVECRQRICDDCTFLEKGCQTMAVYTSKEYWAQDRTLRNPVMKRLLLRDPTVDADRLESIRQIRLKNHSKTLLDMPNMSCKRVRRMLWSNVSNAADRSSKVRMETWPSSALPRRQFVTSRRAVSVLWCAQSAAGRSQRDCWPTNGREADEAQPSPTPWKKMAGLTQAYSFFLDYLYQGLVF